ncbi:MAG: IS66 family insertion sequence element accessory protein TnpB [Polyangiaceae bacterium]
MWLSVDGGGAEGGAPLSSIAAVVQTPARLPLTMQPWSRATSTPPLALRLFWGRNGFVLYLKSGRFQLPAVDERTNVAMEPAQLAMLLDGIDLNARRLARWTPETHKGIGTDRRM